MIVDHQDLIADELSKFRGIGEHNAIVRKPRVWSTQYGAWLYEDDPLLKKPEVSVWFIVCSLIVFFIYLYVVAKAFITTHY